jgi:hypothetical protein
MKHFPLDNDQLTKFQLPDFFFTPVRRRIMVRNNSSNASNFATASYHVATVVYLQVIQPLNSRL